MSLVELVGPHRSILMKIKQVYTTCIQDFCKCKTYIHTYYSGKKQAHVLALPRAIPFNFSHKKTDELSSDLGLPTTSEIHSELFIHKTPPF